MLIHENGIYKQYYEKGLDLIKKEEYDAAIRCFNKSLRLSHYDSIDSWGFKGEALYKLGKYDEAIDCLDQIIDDVNNDDLLMLKGESLLKLGIKSDDNSESKRKYLQAIECFKKISSKEKILVAYGKIGESLIELYKLWNQYEPDEWINECNKNRDNLVNDLKVFEEGNELTYDNCEYAKLAAVYNKIGLSYYINSNYENALSYFNNAKENYDKINDEYRSKNIDLLSDILYNKGMVFYQKSNPKNAIQCFHKSLEIKPTNTDALNQQGLCYLDIGECDKAMKQFNEVIEIDVKLKYVDEKLWYNKGIAYYNLFKYSEAMECFDKSILLRERFAEAWCGKGKSLYNMGKYEHAKTCFEEAKKHKQNYLEVVNDEGLNLSMIGDYNGAIEKYDEIIEKLEDNKESFLYIYATNNKAMAEANKGRYEVALGIINTLLKTSSSLKDSENKNYSFLYDTKGFILLKQKKYDQSLEILEKAIELNPLDKYAWLHKGYVHFELKEYNESIGKYDEALQIDEDFAEAHHAKAVSLSYKGDRETAIKEIKRSISLKPTLVNAYENLAKLSILSNKGQQNFLDFWNVSLSRKIIAILLGLFLLFSIGFIFYESMGPPKEIHPFQYAIPVSIVLILLSPQISKAKMGPIELELSKDPRQIQPSLGLST